MGSSAKVLHKPTRTLRLEKCIMNAQDNEYPDGVEPSLEFVMTSTDITTTSFRCRMLKLKLGILKLHRIMKGYKSDEKIGGGIY
ncbi:hypothetical protein C5167_035295, partial [Papaver somniferum]